MVITKVNLLTNAPSVIEQTQGGTWAYMYGRYPREKPEHADPRALLAVGPKGSTPHRVLLGSSLAQVLAHLR